MDQVVSWLQLLNHSILLARLDTYDVSECFLSIQGAALRFTAQRNELEIQTRGHDEYDDDLLTSIWEESMWAAAALARICVGPAWLYQLQQRKAFLVHHNHHYHNHIPGDDATWESGSSSLQNETTPIEIVATNNSSPRSFSPMTFASAIDGDMYFPSIPEALPGVMLRFGASALEALPNQLATRSLAEAQREMVLALCCCSGELEGPERVDWTIPSAHAPVENMMRFWLNASTVEPQNERVQSKKGYRSKKSSGHISPGIPADTNPRQAHRQEDIASKSTTSHEDSVTTVEYIKEYVRNDDLLVMDQLKGRSLDWWYSLEVARASMDLISSGWRPQRGHDIVLHLLDMAEKGISLQGMTCDSSDTGKKSREERLAATASAAEAMSALSSMGSRGLIPESTKVQLVEVLIDLQVIADFSAKLAMSLYPFGATTSEEDDEERQQERETFLTQRDACFANNADFLWVLLAEPSSAAVTASALLEMLSCKADAKTNVITRVLSGALWGKPPNVPSIEHLRIYWSDLMNLLKVKSQSAILECQQKQSSSETINVDTLTLVLEIIAAIDRFVETTLICGNVNLSPTEWDLFVQTLDTSVISWLYISDPLLNTCVWDDEFSAKKRLALFSNIQRKVEDILLKVGEFLGKAAVMEQGPYHFTLDAENRSILHLMILRKAVPMMDAKKATVVGCCVIRSWASLKVLPFRREEWGTSASIMANEAFAVFEDENFGFHDGYVHSALVRLEVLKVITDDGYERSRYGAVDEESNSSAKASSYIPSYRQSRYLHEQYLEVSNEVLFLALRRVFGLARCLVFRSNGPPMHEELSNMRAFMHRSRLSHLDCSEFALRTFAVRLIGKLFRSEVGNQEHSSSCIAMLHMIGKPLKEELECEDMISDGIMNTSQGSLLSRRAVVAIEAIRQLELCLSAAFKSLSYSHSNSDAIINVLIALMEESCISMQNLCCVNESQIQIAFIVLTFGTLLPIARLRTTFDKRLFLVDRDAVVQHVPDSLTQYLTEKLEQDDDNERYDTMDATFVAEENLIEADQSDLQKLGYRSSTKWSLISFAHIISSITVALQAFTNATNTFEEDTVSSRFVNDLRERFIATSFDALGNYFLSCTYLPSLFNITSALLSVAETKGSCKKEVEVSRCKTLSVVAQKMIALEFGDTVHQITDTNDNAITESAMTAFSKVIDVVLATCLSEDVDIVIIGCRNLRPLLVSLSRCHKLVRSENISIMLQKLCHRLEYAITNTSKASTEMLEPCTKYWTHGGDVVLALLSVIDDLVSQLKSNGHGLLTNGDMNVISLCYHITQHSDRSKACKTLAMRCFFIALNKLSLPEVENLLFLSCSDRCNTRDVMAIDNASPLSESDEPNIALALVLQRLKNLRRSHVGVVEVSAVEIHEGIARETEDMKRFLVEKRETSERSSAWLHGYCLLTIRIGATSSRYCGWVEVILRSPSSRKRHLIRTLPTVSIDQPEMPSSLWEEKYGSPKLSLGMSRIERLPIYVTPFEDCDILSRALHLVDFCDAEHRSYLENIGFQGGDSIGLSQHSLESSPQRHSAKTRSPLTSPQALDLPRKRDDREYLSESLSASDSPDSIHSIHKWLHEVVGAEKVKNIEEYLYKIGLSRDAVMTSAEMPCLKNESTPLVVTPKRMRLDAKSQRAISILDRTTTINSHKVALLYAGRPIDGHDKGLDQAFFEPLLLGNYVASSAFYDFSRDLGRLVKTKHLTYFSGGIDTSGQDADGKYALAWIDDDVMMMFHTVLLMPEGFNARKRHVGNDNVHILFVDPSSSLYLSMVCSGPEIETSTTLVSGQFGFLTIFVLPLERINRVIVQLKPGLDRTMRSQLVHFCGNSMVHKEQTATHVRQIAMQADLACKSLMDHLLGPPTVWEDRYFQLNSMKRFCVSSNTNTF